MGIPDQRIFAIAIWRFDQVIIGLLTDIHQLFRSVNLLALASIATLCCQLELYARRHLSRRRRAKQNAMQNQAFISSFLFFPRMVFVLTAGQSWLMAIFCFFMPRAASRWRSVLLLQQRQDGYCHPPDQKEAAFMYKYQHTILKF